MAWKLGDVLGQEEAIGRLRRERLAGRLAHAYMFEGAQGTGKVTFAHGVSAAVLCNDPTADGDACGVCRSCHMLHHANHPDYLELPREGAELRIGQFVDRSGAAGDAGEQPLLPFLRLKPVEGGMRVAVVPDAERLRAEAANAFLKTLEEPPGQTLILLTVTARDRLPATITSRCRRIGIKPLPEDVIARELALRLGTPEADAREMAVTAEGSLGLAQKLGSGETLVLWRWLAGEAFAKPGLAGAQALADMWLGFGGLEGDNAGKRKNALAALDLTALAVRLRMRQGLHPTAGARILATLWNAADQVGKNVRPDLALVPAAFEIMAVLRTAG